MKKARKPTELIPSITADMRPRSNPSQPAKTATTIPSQPIQRATTAVFRIA